MVERPAGNVFASADAFARADVAIAVSVVVAAAGATTAADFTSAVGFGGLDDGCGSDLLHATKTNGTIRIAIRGIFEVCMVFSASGRAVLEAQNLSSS